MARVLSEADIKRNEKIVKLWNEGLNQTTLAKRFNLDAGHISSIITQARKSRQTVRAGNPGRPGNL